MKRTVYAIKALAVALSVGVITLVLTIAARRLGVDTAWAGPSTALIFIVGVLVWNVALDLRDRWRPR